jgi:hypothetical protein
MKRHRSMDRGMTGKGERGDGPILRYDSQIKALPADCEDYTPMACARHPTLSGSGVTQALLWDETWNAKTEGAARVQSL